MNFDEIDPELLQAATTVEAAASARDGSGTPAPYPLTTQNLVCTSRLGVNINPRDLAELTCGYFKPSRFPAAICCVRLPTATCVVFANGNSQLVGTHHKMDALLVAHLLMREIYRNFRIFPKFHFFTVCNVVCSLSLGHYLDLPRFFKDHRNRCVYNVESFEGCQFYIKRDPCQHNLSTTLVMFRTGRIVITGGTSRRQQLEHMRKLLPILRMYRLDAPPPVNNTGRKSRKSGPLPSMILPHLIFRNRVPASTHRESAAWFNVAPGPGGCRHSELLLAGKEQWSDDAQPRCLSCKVIGAPFKFPVEEHECEHEAGWTTSPDNKHECDLCGVFDTTGLFDKYQSKQLRRAEAKQRRARISIERKQRASVQQSTPVSSSSNAGPVGQSRRKRFKPTSAPLPGTSDSLAIPRRLEDPRTLAEQRLCDEMNSMTLKPVQTERQPLRIHRASAPQTPV